MYETLSGALAGRLTLLVSSYFCVTGNMFNMVSLFQYRGRKQGMRSKCTPRSIISENVIPLCSEKHQYFSQQRRITRKS